MADFDFSKEVLKRSFELPVVVDFWAPWCGPCRFLGPVIEELDATDDRWELVKVNTDEHQELMSEYQIKGIPAVKMFRKGEVTAEFTGALPKHQIKEWLDKNIPDERIMILEAISKKLSDQQQKETAITELREFVNKHPDLTQASLLLAQEILVSEPKEAFRLTEDIQLGDEGYDEVLDLRNLVCLLQCPKEDENKVSELLVKAAEYLKHNDYDNCLHQLIEAIRIDKNYCDELPRKAAIAIFHRLGHQHEISAKYLRSFNMALY